LYFLSHSLNLAFSLKALNLHNCVKLFTKEQSLCHQYKFRFKISLY